MSEDAGEGLTVLLIDADQATVDGITSHAAGTGVSIRTATSSAEAQDLLTDTVDCLIVDPDVFVDGRREEDDTSGNGESDGSGGDGETTLARLLQVAPDTPLVLLTSRDPGVLSDSTIAAAATIVEKRDETADWTFLFEKIRGVVREDVGRDGGSDAGGSATEDDEMHRMLVESARDGLYRLNANGVFTYLNESFAEILGYGREELLGTHTSIVMAEGELERGQGVVRQVLDSDERESDLMDMTMETKSGEQITVAIHFVVLTDDAGRYNGVMGVMRDITDRKERERALQRQNERLEEFASIVSHDLRNPLNVAQGNLDLVARDCDSEYLDPVETALDRMAVLIEETLELARQGEMVTETEPVALDGIVAGCWEMVDTGDATLETPESGVIRADPDRVKQLFENLFRNAVEHGSTSPGSQARQDAVEHGGADVAITVGLLDDGFFVADDGPGILADEREQVFEPGYTDSNDGTGFGLSIVKRIVEAHDWSIEIAKSAAGGTRFEITGVAFVE